MDTEKSLRGNIWKFALLLVTNKRIFAAIIGAYYLTIPNVDVQGVGIILLAGSLGGFLFEIPTGYLADRVGHKQALIAARVFALLSTAFFLVANNLAVLILGAVALSAATAFQSGTGSAFMHETLKGLKREKDYATVMGKISSIGFAIPIAFMVTVPFLVGISFKLPFALGLVIDVIGFFTALSLTVPPVPTEETKEIGPTNFKQALKEGHRFHFFGFALFSGILSGMLFAVGGFRAPYQMFLAVPVIWYGVLFGIGRGLASLMLAYTGKIKEKMTVYSFFKFKLILYAVLILALALAPETWMVVALFIIINAFQWGLSRTNNSFMVDIVRSSRFKATLLSIQAQVNRIAAGVASFGIGFAVEKLSYHFGFLFLGIAFLIILVPIYLFIEKQRKAGVYDQIFTSA